MFIDSLAQSQFAEAKIEFKFLNARGTFVNVPPTSPALLNRAGLINPI